MFECVQVAEPHNDQAVLYRTRSTNGLFHICAEEVRLNVEHAWTWALETVLNLSDNLNSAVPASGQSVASGSFCFAWGANSQNSSPGCNLSAAIHLWFLLFKILWWRPRKTYLKNDKNSQRQNVPCLACEMKARCASSCTGCAHFHWVTATSPCEMQIKRWWKKRVEKLAKQIG